MPPRRSFKSDKSFFRMIVMGAVGARAVRDDLGNRGHAMYELENGATDTKIWKDVKRKRVRIPDLVCITCGLRVESRAKTTKALAMSHSPEDAERAWDFGMVDCDVVAFPVCRSAADTGWSRGQLKGAESFWHSQDHVRWVTYSHINYINVLSFRGIPASQASTKGVTEGSETSLAWDAIFSTWEGTVEAIRDGQICVRRSSDGRRYTWQNKKQLPVVVEKGNAVKEMQILAAAVRPLNSDELQCPSGMAVGHIENLLLSPERTQRFTGIKLARLRDESEYAESVERLIRHADEDLYVQIEGAIYLTRTCGRSASRLFKPYVESADEQTQLEGIVGLAEAGSPEAVEMLCATLDRANAPFFLRSAAAWGLGRTGAEMAAQRLIRAFSDVNEDIREEALEAIEAIGEPAVRHLLDGLAEADESVAAGAAEAIRRKAELPAEIIQEIVSIIKADPGRVWPVWLLGHLPSDREYIMTAIADLQDSKPEVHYAIVVLWAFVESWVSRHWEARPVGEVRQ